MPEDGEHVFGSGKPVEDLQPFLFADRIDEGVFPRMILAGQPAAELRQPTEGERRRTALAPQLAGREHRDGGRIQPAAQMDAHGVRASQMVLHRREKRSTNASAWTASVVGRVFGACSGRQYRSSRVASPSTVSA